MFDPEKRREWAAAWPLPFVAMLGVAGSGIFTFSSGVFMEDILREFGWSRTQYSSAMMMPMLMCLIFVPVVGRVVDRVGPRRVALFGIVPTVIGTALLGLANGQLWQWYLLCLVQAAGAVIIVPPVWLAAVVGRFHASRGLSLAFALAGTGIGTALWPVLAALAIDRLGWRLAYAALAIGWGAVLLPLTFLFFRGARDVARDAGGAARPRSAPPPPYLHILRSPAFLCLAGSGGLFICICYGLTLHLVPILRENGLDRGDAAWVAGLAGIFSIVGRVSTGFLLDIVPSRPFGVIVFTLPLAVCALLLGAQGSFAMALAAVMLLGLAMGAESDILTYIVSRRFDPALFGSIYSVVQTVFAVTSISGAILAGRLYDLSGSYALFLTVLIPMTLIGTALLATVPSVGRGAAVPAPATPPIASVKVRNTPWRA